MIDTSTADAGNNLPKYLRVKDILEMIPVSDNTASFFGKGFYYKFTNKLICDKYSINI